MNKISEIPFCRFPSHIWRYTTNWLKIYWTPRLFRWNCAKITAEIKQSPAYPKLTPSADMRWFRFFWRATRHERLSQQPRTKRRPGRMPSWTLQWRTQRLWARNKVDSIWRTWQARKEQRRLRTEEKDYRKAPTSTKVCSRSEIA